MAGKYHDNSNFSECIIFLWMIVICSAVRTSLTVLRLLSIQGLTKLPDYIQFKEFPAIPFKSIFKAAGDDLLDLLSGLLSCCPAKRLDSTQATKSLTHLH